MQLIPFDEREHQYNLLNLVNHHLSAVVPGWTLPMDHLLQHLKRNIFQDIVDPWVIERRTLCAVEGGRVLAAAHLLRYGDGKEVGEWYQNAGDVGWIFALPDEQEAGIKLLEAVRQQMIEWGVRSVSAFDASLPLPLVHGLPDCWPHIRALLVQAGFGRLHPREETVYGGWLNPVSMPGDSSVPGVRLERKLKSGHGVAFTAVHDGQVIGWCECDTDLTRGGEIPTLAGWAELSEIYMEEAWRSRGVGEWLVRHAVEWIRLAGCERVALSVDSEDDGRGAGRFYQRFGWQPITRLEIGWGYTLFTPA